MASTPMPVEGVQILREFHIFLKSGVSAASHHRNVGTLHLGEWFKFNVVAKHVDLIVFHGCANVNQVLQCYIFSSSNAY